MNALLRLVPAGPPRRAGHIASKTTTEQPGNGHQRPSTVLVVEDEILIRMPVADYLRDCGYRVLEASNAAEAQALFRASEPIEIVFSDVNMPGGMNGFALAQWVRQEYPDVRIILTSGIASTARNAEQVCAEGSFLEKPYSYEALAAHIKRLLAAGV
ncbi:response regulator [Vineibacter terrae]|uniref:Response regulator n=1 Tax=Vineibacter terrae TaxID=2586908 RepID=A0A5C8PJG2_9HYPH|nr:response regulator [Vineibacter terrae]TXL73954.1 response regulator [Vineibacter terrae]